MKCDCKQNVEEEEEEVEEEEEEVTLHVFKKQRSDFYETFVEI